MSIAAALWLSLASGSPLLVAPPTTAPEEPRSAPRGNRSLDPRRRGAVFSVGAAPRLGLLLGNGRDLVGVPGFGFGLQIRAHFLNLVALRLGLAFQAGHQRFPDLRRLQGVELGTGRAVTRERWARLSHTDLALGPSFDIPLGPVLLGGDVGAGMGINQYFEPRGAFESFDDREVTSYDPLLRGGVFVGVPIRNDHGVSLGVDLYKYFSSAEFDTGTSEAPGEVFSPFDLLLSVSLAYTAWF